MRRTSELRLHLLVVLALAPTLFGSGSKCGGRCRWLRLDPRPPLAQDSLPALSASHGILMTDWSVVHTETHECQGNRA